MLAKIKKWFSVENNVNLVRDILFVGSLLLAMILGLIMCSPVAHATEVETTTEATETEDLFCLSIPSYKVGETTYNGFSVKIPYECTDKIFAYYDSDKLHIFAIDVLDYVDDCYVSAYDSGKGGNFALYGTDKIRSIYYTYDGSDLVLVHDRENTSDGSSDGSISLGTFYYEFSDFEIVYSTSDILSSSDNSVYFHASDSLASTMSGLLSFGRSVVDLWGSISDFATDNIYVFLPLLAWLLVMAFGGLFKLFKA